MDSIVAPIITGLTVGIVLIILFAYAIPNIPSTVTKTLTVKIDCLPLKNSVFGGHNTDYCKLGLVDKNGRHYGVNPSEKSNRLLTITIDSSNKVFKVTGNVTSPPPEELKWYDVAGVIDVDSFTRLDEGYANNIICGQSIERVKSSAPFAILLPKSLPDGYSLQSLDYVPKVYAIMQYFTRSLCDPNNPYSPDEGVIEIVEAPLSTLTNGTGEQYLQEQMAKFQESNLEAKNYIFQDGRMHAVGYDAGIGASRAIDEKGNIVHQEPVNYAAHLWVVDDKTGTIVKIEARSTDIPLEQLAAIGESLEQ